MARELRRPEDDERPASHTQPDQSHPVRPVHKHPRPRGGTAARLLEASNSCHKDARTRRGEPRRLAAGCPSKQHLNCGKSRLGHVQTGRARALLFPRWPSTPPTGVNLNRIRGRLGFPTHRTPQSHTGPHRAPQSHTGPHGATPTSGGVGGAC